MIQANDIALFIGGRTLFKEASFSIYPGDRIGLIGRNGAGKSTLLKLLSRKQSVDAGNISIPTNYTLSFLEQKFDEDDTQLLYDYMYTAFAKQLEIQNQFDKTWKQIESRQDYESQEYMDLLDKQAVLQNQLNVFDASKTEKSIELVLKGLGFEEQQFHNPLSTFSGGWRVKADLAKALLSNPDLLLLDEPNNHLDIHSIIWLEQFLATLDGSVIIVSHDQKFLENVCNKILEIENERIFEFKGTYQEYIVNKIDRREKLLAAQKNQEKEIKQIERNIERFRAKASKAKFAQSLIKKLEKTDIIEVEEGIGDMRIKFPEPPSCGKIALEIKGLDKSYGENSVLENIQLTINSGSRVAFVGKNGMGKTTLSKIIANKLKPSAGTVTLGHNVALNYYEQESKTMVDGDLTVLQKLDNAAKGEIRTKVRSILGSFLFSGDDVEKKIKVLSGGELSRLRLAELLLDPANLLILDEPTNHLDIASKHRLKQALLEYTGTLIVVSHDRSFLEDLVDIVIEFDNKSLKEFSGSVNEFLASKNVENFRSFETDNEGKGKPNPKNSNQNKKKDKSKISNKEQRKIQKASKQITNKINKLEQEISALEITLKELEKNIADPSINSTPEDYEYYADQQKSLMKTEKAWMDAQEELERFESQ